MLTKLDVVKQLISWGRLYFGRYSLAEPGLIYTGGTELTTLRRVLP